MISNTLFNVYNECSIFDRVLLLASVQKEIELEGESPFLQSLWVNIRMEEVAL